MMPFLGSPNPLLRHIAACTLVAALVLLSPLASGDDDWRCDISAGAARLDTCQARVELDPGLPDSLGRAASNDGRFAVVKYDGPIRQSSRRALADAGVEVLEYLPWFAYVVRAPEGLPDDPAIAHVGDYLPAWKLDPSLFNLTAAYREATIPVDVRLWPGADVGRIQDDWMADEVIEFQFHVQVGDSDRLGARIRADALEDVATALAGDPSVRSITLRRQNRLFNSQAGWLHQSGESPGEVPVFDRGIYGCGQVIGVLDSGFDYGSCAFRNEDGEPPPVASCADGTNCPAEPLDEDQRKIGRYYNWSGGATGDDACGQGSSIGHGTHVAGSIAGNDLGDPVDCTNGTTPGGQTNLDGTAPGAQLVTQQAGVSLEYLNDHGGNIYHAAEIAYDTGARIHNNSWGSGCCLLGVICQCSEALPYDGNARLADEVNWDFPDLVLAIAAGNDGDCCGSESIGNPALAKNSLTVGANQRGENGDNRASFSSLGPTQDRRIKPDVMAQGDGILSAGSSGDPDSESCTECEISGTSMASPTAAGLAALVRDYLAQGFYPSGEASPDDAMDSPPAALVRALVINSARSIDGADTGGDAPNQNQGWGRVTLDDALYFDGDSRGLWLAEPEGGLVTDAVDEWQVEVSDGEPLQVTLVWTDYPGAEGADPAIVNLLRLEVITPDGEVLTQKLPASGDPNPFWDTDESGFDDRNTVHKYTTDEAAGGEWTFRVRGVSVAMGDVQPYALVASGGVDTAVEELLFADGFEPDQPESGSPETNSR